MNIITSKRRRQVIEYQYTTGRTPVTMQVSNNYYKEYGELSEYAPIGIPIKDDPSVTPTLETLCTLDTCSSHSTNIDTDAILRITIWNQPIVQYRMPIRPFASHHPQQPSIAVRYALIGVYDKLLNPSKLPCLLSFFTSIISVALLCFNFLAESFTLVKIDDRYPDEWND